MARSANCTRTLEYLCTQLSVLIGAAIDNCDFFKLLAEFCHNHSALLEFGSGESEANTRDDQVKYDENEYYDYV